MIYTTAATHCPDLGQWLARSSLVKRKGGWDLMKAYQIFRRPIVGIYFSFLEYPCTLLHTLHFTVRTLPRLVMGSIFQNIVLAMDIPLWLLGFLRDFYRDIYSNPIILL